MSDGRVIHVAQGDRHVLRYLGRADYTMAPAIERVAEGLLEGHVTKLLFDLRGARMLDSTNLGLIARLAARADGAGCQCTIVSTNDDISAVVRSMGLQSMMPVVDDDPVLHSEGSEDEIVFEPTAQRELMRTMLEAHRVLASMDEKDDSGFRAVVQCLESELDVH